MLVLGEETHIPTPANEQSRLKALHSYGILDTHPESDFDSMTSLVTELLKMPIAAVSLVDRDRQWFKSQVGLGVPETSRDIAFCAHAICQDNPFFEVEDAQRDSRFWGNPLVTQPDGIRFYAGRTLRSHDRHHALGTFCVIDRVPRKLTDDERGVLDTLAMHVENALELRRVDRVLKTRAAELDARSELLRQSAKYVSHDLREPLSTASTIAETMLENYDEATALGGMGRSLLAATQTMDRLFTNLLDVWAADEGQLSLNMKQVRIWRLFDSVTNLFLRSHPSARIAILSDQSIEVECDAVRIEGVLQNLVANAISHGGSDVDIVVSALSSESEIVVEVSDNGGGPAYQQLIFKPRLKSLGSDGDGLGLAFCKRAVEAHGGNVRIETCTAGGTRIIVTLPTTQ